MKLALVGLSHKTAPVEVREQFAFSADAIVSALATLVKKDGVSEALIISTCNRVELVAETPDETLLKAFLADFHKVSPSQIAGYLYAYKNLDAVRHVFRVTSSLDSMMVGEPQILGQVKEAYRIASDAGAVGIHLNALYNRAFAVAKKVRTETAIAHSAVSVSYAAVELARKIFGDLNGKSVMIIGASKMGELAAKHLRRAGVSLVLVTNRTFERAVELARVFAGAAVPFEHLNDHLDRADIVISSTGAPHFIITKAQAAQIIQRRRHRPMFFIDIAVPRDIDPTVNDVDNIFLYDIDDLQQVVDENLKERLNEARRAEQIVDQEVDRFFQKLQVMEVSPTIVELRETLERVRREEIERNRKHLGALSPEQQAAVDRITQSLVNKILHAPITELKEVAQHPHGSEVVAMIRRIFAVKPK